MKNIVSVSLALIISALTSVHSSATIYHAGSFTATTTPQAVHSSFFPNGTGAVSDTIYFTLLAPKTKLIAGALNVSGDSFIRFTNFGGSLYNSSNTLLASVSSPDYNKILETGYLSPGDYRLDVSGGIAGFGGGYGIAITSNAPEPETWAMMLAGLGLVASATRRKKLALLERTNNS
ncbi:MAG: FxDxF family PEP-CTERM protein [Pseudomonadota bacterium]